MKMRVFSEQNNSPLRTYHEPENADLGISEIFFRVLHDAKVKTGIDRIIREVGVLLQPDEESVPPTMTPDRCSDRGVIENPATSEEKA
jgi:hypothetical protein